MLKYFSATIIWTNLMNDKGKVTGNFVRPAFNDNVDMAYRS